MALSSERRPEQARSHRDRMHDLNVVIGTRHCGSELARDSGSSDDGGQADCLAPLRLSLFMRMTQPLTAVGQVQTHGGPRRIGILTGNGIVDFFVLAAQATHVVLLVIVGQSRGVEPGAGNDAGAQVGHDVGEIAVTGG